MGFESRPQGRARPEVQIMRQNKVTWAMDRQRRDVGKGSSLRPKKLAPLPSVSSTCLNR